MSKNETILRFEEVSFEYNQHKPILDEVSFSLRSESKVTIMGQNGAGKSTIFGLITGDLKPESGRINVVSGVTIAISKQVIPREDLSLTVREFFQKCFEKKMYDIDPRIDEVLEVVNLKGHTKVHDRIIKTFSGGQQARLLLASALIQNPDLLLLDEPTNNLDAEGIAHLRDFLINYDKTVMVISHDADFLNAFSTGVLYLDIHTHKVEQYLGNYKNVLKDIALRIEAENRKNAQLEKEVQKKKDQANIFAHKSGSKIRLVAKQLKAKAEKLEEEIVDVRKEDKAIRPFTIPSQKDLTGTLLKISSYTLINRKAPAKLNSIIYLNKDTHLLIKGPNGIGKTTLLESIAKGEAAGIDMHPDVRIGYYRQDFSNLNFENTVYEWLTNIMDRKDEEGMRSIAAGFLLNSEIMKTKVGDLSEGQKGLVAFAGLVLLRPGLLILDEPTNHINFRHIPVIAKALSSYTGAMILVSHVPDFVSQIRIDEVLDLEK